MVNVTLAVPSEMKHKMDGFAEINWSAAAREAFDQKIRYLELIKKFKSDSTMTEPDTIRIGRKLNEQLAKKRLLK
jgi:hypothetical protein